MPKFGVAVAGSFLLLAVGAAAPLHAQKPSGGGGGAGGGAPRPPSNPGPSSPPLRSGSGNQPNYPNAQPMYPNGINAYGYGDFPSIDPQRAALYDRLRRQERQKQVVKDTDRLVKLTSEYQDKVKVSGDTADAQKRLAEIEKLARQLRATLVQ